MSDKNLLEIQQKKLESVSAVLAELGYEWLSLETASIAHALELKIHDLLHPIQNVAEFPDNFE